MRVETVGNERDYAAVQLRNARIAARVLWRIRWQVTRAGTGGFTLCMPPKLLDKEGERS